MEFVETTTTVTRRRDNSPGREQTPRLNRLGIGDRADNSIFVVQEHRQGRDKYHVAGGASPRQRRVHQGHHIVGRRVNEDTFVESLHVIHEQLPKHQRIGVGRRLCRGQSHRARAHRLARGNGRNEEQSCRCVLVAAAAES